MKHQCLFLCIAIAILTSCDKDEKLFTRLPDHETGIDFVNEIVVRDTLNILDNEFVYNGGGVAVGDVNNDGLQDIYFTGNLVENRLYLNQGNFGFKDITKKAGVEKRKGQWSAGVTMIDINGDGLLDIYVCNTMSPKKEALDNLLFINQGIDKKGIPFFKEMAAEYGLQDGVHDSASSFLDYDNDGDLDIFLAVNFIDTQYPNQFITQTRDGSSPTRDRLFENRWDDRLNHPVFNDVSLKAGIVHEGYSHSVLANDFNLDGWMDIYVCNDYLSNDILYLNNRDGTFTNRIADSFKHLSLSAMGSDLGDINNDGREDLFVSEMLPYDNKRKKLFLNANSYQTYIFTEQFKYQYQYVRNSLQINRGLDPKSGLPIFSDVAFLAGVQETDWSWSSLFIDMDNDGFRDLLVTNGFPRDVTDHDFGSFRSSNMSRVVSKTELYMMIPEIRVPNFIFRNNGDLTFTDVSFEWSESIPSFSNGAAYADLDNDGDVDYVVNNINDKAFVFRNNLERGPATGANFLRLDLVGDKNNPDAFNSKATVHYNDNIQEGIVLSGRGYLSNSETILHFGLGHEKVVDSLVIRWYDNSKTVIRKPSLNQLLKVEYKTASRTPPTGMKGPDAAVFKELSSGETGLDYEHEETDFIDFNFQRTLPHKFSQYGPGMAVGDLNGDGREDIIFGGSARFDQTVFYQDARGKFSKEKLSLKLGDNKKEEDLGMILFDADRDGDNDLYISRGSYQHEPNSDLYQHFLCINDGKGNLKIDTLSSVTTCGSAVKAADFDRDGDLDLFVGGRVLPHSFPKPDKSFLLRNDTESKDKIRFTDVTALVLPSLTEIGMVSDALWTDFDNDSKIDLVLACEWNSLIFLKNDGNKFIDVTAISGLNEYLGWWTSLSAGDYDNDGDTDYIAGNFGQNIYFKCSAKEPLSLYAKDFDGNGSYDPFISCFWRDSTDAKHEYFYHTRDDMVKQLITIRRKFEKYGAFGAATVDQVFSAEELKGAEILKTNYLSTAFVENLGNAKFKISELPVEAQYAPIYGSMSYDFNADGLLDILLVGNDYGLELMQGRADAFYGLLLQNTGKNNFVSVDLDRSHFIVPGDARALGTVVTVDRRELIIATQNRDSLKVFFADRSKKFFEPRVNDAWAVWSSKDGKKNKIEFYYGSGFLSQSSRKVRIPDHVVEMTVFDFSGTARKIDLENLP